MSSNFKVKQGNKALGSLVEIHAALGTVNSDIRGPSRPHGETEAGQTSEVFPGLASDEDVLQLTQGSTEA